MQLHKIQKNYSYFFFYSLETIFNGVCKKVKVIIAENSIVFPMDRNTYYYRIPFDRQFGREMFFAK